MQGGAGRICRVYILPSAPVGVDYKNGKKAEAWLSAWRAFLGELDAQGQLDWHEVFADGTFARAKKGGPWSEKPNAEWVLEQRVAQMNVVGLYVCAFMPYILETEAK